jgi:hypothetical protein
MQVHHKIMIELVGATAFVLGAVAVWMVFS